MRRASTRSLFGVDFDYHEIDGRTYIADYFLPIDEEETERWSLMHSIYYQSLNDSHTTVPLDNPKRILDVGCGRGDWASDIGAQYPGAKVTGSDIAPLQDELSKERNVQWEIDDAEMYGGWAYSEKFDFIHFRTMKGAFKDWTYIYEQVFDNLVPGGWVEVVDYEDYNNILSRLGNDPWLAGWYHSLMEAIDKSSRPFSSAHLEPELLLQQGFEEVTTEVFPIPIGAWGVSESDITNATVFLKLQTEAVLPLCLRFLHDYGGWPLDQINASCERIRELMLGLATDPELARGCTLNIKVLRGRKPQ